MTNISDAEVMKRDGVQIVEPVEKQKGEEEKLADARKTAAASIVAVGVVIISYWLLLRSTDEYAVIQTLQFAGSPERLSEQNLVVTVEDARAALLRAVAFSVIWGGVGWVLLNTFWEGAWKAGVGRKIPGARLGLIFGLGGAVFGVAEKLFTLITVRGDGASIRFADSWRDAIPKTIVTIAWVKWLLAGIMILLAVAMLVSSMTAAIRRLLRPAEAGVPDSTPDDDCHTVPSGTGICCSGGGIRAAGFALGALSRLEQEPSAETIDGKLGILGRADYLASVSGGGYAAAAWRIAAGPGPLPDHPIIGDPTDLEAIKSVRRYPDPDKPAPSLLQHIRERRRYLGNGPGGMLTSVLIIIRNMIFHFALIILTVIALAWPLGRAIVSWAITGDGQSSSAMVRGVTTDIRVHQWFPPVALAALALPFLLARIRLDRKPVRKKIDLGIAGLLGVAASLALLLIVLPIAVDWLIGALPSGGGRRIAVGGTYAVVLTALWQLTKTRLVASARYLGGLVLFAGLTAFGLFVMAHAADTDETFSSKWVWMACAAAMVIAFVFFNPDRWSLHGFYRERLAGTFSTKRTESTKRAGSDFVTHPDEPAIHTYARELGVEGPQPVICCAAAREDGQQTGVPVLSLTFEPSCVTVYRWSDTTSSARTAPARMSYAQFRRRLPGGNHGRNLSTLMGLAAVSGAAVAPSLGRLSVKGTDALLAAFNARLGVWLPNPSQQKWKRSTTPRLVNMFKEISKTYDHEDPNVYATDGGHWENLGLVELVRRRCTTIIIIDTSGDVPGTYKTFKLARKLAELECGAKLDLDKESWEHLGLVGPDATVGRNYGVGTVTYDDTSTGRLLYVKAAVMESSPLEIQRYAADDGRFPNYSTADQMLTEDEFNHLLHLGYASMDEALKTHGEFEAGILDASGIAVASMAEADSG